MSLQSVNPVTGEVLETFTPTSSRELDTIVAQSHAAFLERLAASPGRVCPHDDARDGQADHAG